MPEEKVDPVVADVPVPPGTSFVLTPLPDGRYAVQLPPGGLEIKPTSGGGYTVVAVDEPGEPERVEDKIRAWAAKVIGNLQSELGDVFRFSRKLVFGFARGIFSPAASSLKAFLVPRELYGNGATWSSAGWQTGAILGPVAGGLLYARFGLEGTLLVVMALLAGSSLLVLGIRPRGVPPIPGCVVLMWTRPHPQSPQSPRSVGRSSSTTLHAGPQPEEHR